MKNLIGVLLAAMICVSLAACSKPSQAIAPQASQMKSICELATMQCYYHNVAKYYQENAESGILGIGSKDRKFWVEYSGIVTVGIDASQVAVQIDGDDVTVALPPAKVMSCKVDNETLTKDSFIVAQGSASVKAEHQTEAFREAQEQMWQATSNDTTLLANAQQRAQQLLEDYVNNIGDGVGKKYRIHWVYLENAESAEEMEGAE